MEPITISIILAVIASISELMSFTKYDKANGLLHALYHGFLHVHTESDCHIELDVDVQHPEHTEKRRSERIAEMTKKEIKQEE